MRMTNIGFSCSLLCLTERTLRANNGRLHLLNHLIKMKGTFDFGGIIGGIVIFVCIYFKYKQ